MIRKERWDKRRSQAIMLSRLTATGELSAVLSFHSLLLLLRIYDNFVVVLTATLWSVVELGLLYFYQSSLLTSIASHLTSPTYHPPSSLYIFLIMLLTVPLNQIIHFHSLCRSQVILETKLKIENNWAKDAS